MARAQLIIASVVVEGRSKSQVARDYGVSRFWVQQLVHLERPLTVDTRTTVCRSDRLAKLLRLSYTWQ